jgi:flagellar protein FliS
MTMTTPQGNGFPMNQTLLRAAYVSNSVETMSPARMIVALYDRLTLDLERAEQAILAADPSTAHECLIHAPAARRLKDIYVFLLFELVGANVDKNAARVAACHALVAPLREAWTSAAGIVPSAPGGRA